MANACKIAIMIRILEKNIVQKVRVVQSFLFALCILLLAQGANCDEIYSVDHNPVFLYKTINWWYDCLPEDAAKLCGRTITCSNSGNALVKYDETRQIIELGIKGALAGMLLVFKQCKQCYGPSYLRCTWIDPKYFTNTTANVMLNDSSIISGIVFNDIKKEQAQRLQSMEHDIQFVLEGVIGGLANGQIALHAANDLLKTCAATSQPQEDNYPITFKIIIGSTKETIATFRMDWNQ